jgi:hypothetical protein
MEYMESVLREYDVRANKMDMVVFPHRIAPEKQVDIFKDLAKSFPEVEFIVAQERNFTKEEYHMILSRSKIVFSANQQETLGISCFEGALVGTYPMVPDRLSYIEMYPSKFKYPSEWTEDWDSYLANKDKLIKHINLVLHADYYDEISTLGDSLSTDFFSGKALYEVIRGKENE